MLEFFMAMDPPRTTHQQQRAAMVGGRLRFYPTNGLKAARQAFMLALAPHRPEEPLTGPLRLEVCWRFPKGRHRDGSYKATRPDTDNLQKLFKDCMTGAGFWYDDAQVASEHVEKRWSGEPGIFVRVQSLNE